MAGEADRLQRRERLNHPAQRQHYLQNTSGRYYYDDRGGVNDRYERGDRDRHRGYSGGGQYERGFDDDRQDFYGRRAERGWRNDRSGWGQDREHRGRDEEHRGRDYYSGEDLDYRGHDLKRPKIDDDFPFWSPPKAKAPARECGQETHRPSSHGHSPAQNQRQLDQSHSQVANPARQVELSANEKLKRELERQEFETTIARQRLETERINQQLRQLKSNDHKLTARNNAATTNQKGRDDNDGNGDNEDIPAPRKSSTKKGTAGQAKITASTKRKLREAQQANDEKMKHELLKAYEADLAALKSKNRHYYTEKDLISSYKPEISA